MKLFINTSNRYKRIVRLVEGGKVVAEKVTDGDVLVAVEELLKEQKFAFLLLVLQRMCVSFSCRDKYVE